MSIFSTLSFLGAGDSNDRAKYFSRIGAARLAERHDGS
jgi:hypothetical protein